MQILDVGCGLGRWTKELVKHFPDADITALDHKRRLPKIKNIKFVKGSVEELPFKNNNFDLVIVSRLLPYVDMINAIKELERVTKKRGLIVYELIEIGYYLKILLKGNIKRIPNFINWILYRKLEFRAFKSCDNIDSNTSLKYFSGYDDVERYSLKSWKSFPVISLTFMSKKKRLDRRLHTKIKKIAIDTLEKET